MLGTEHHEHKKSSEVSLMSQVQSLRAKSSVPLRVNEQKSSSGDMKAREKVELGGLNRMVGSGKENSTVRVSASQKCNDRKNPSGSIRGPTGTKHNVPQKSNTRVLAGPKVQTFNFDDKALIMSIVDFSEINILEYKTTLFS